jgi:hypothetical protein
MVAMSVASNAGWISNGPVQVNVEGDLSIYGSCAPSETDDSVLPRTSSVRSIASAAQRVWCAVQHIASAVWFIAKVIFWIGLALLVLAPVLAAVGLSLCIWILARLGDRLLWIECRLGGGPTHLAYMPTLEHSPSPAQLKVSVASRAADSRHPNRAHRNEAVRRNLVAASSCAPAAPAQLPRSTVK